MQRFLTKVPCGAILLAHSMPSQQRRIVLLGALSLGTSFINAEEPIMQHCISYFHFAFIHPPIRGKGLVFLAQYGSLRQLSFLCVSFTAPATLFTLDFQFRTVYK